MRQPHAQALFGLMAQFGQLIACGKGGQNGLMLGGPKSATLGNLDSALKRFRQVGKQRHHFLGGFQPMVGREAAPVFFV